MSNAKRAAALELIRSNIDRFGCHVYLVTAEAIPRFAYTIGVRETVGAELILAGASFYSAEQVKLILNEAARLAPSASSPQQLSFQLESIGSFSICDVHSTWARALMLGAADYYGQADISAWQVVPDQEHWTLDIPDLRRSWSATLEPCWRWLHEQWSYAVPVQSVATTNLDALRGGRVTEAARWEAEQWELFAGAGPDVPHDEMRVVPLGTLLAIDESLAAVTNLAVGRALWRDESDGEWQPWG
jgi:hypothetical protein